MQGVDILDILKAKSIIKNVLLSRVDSGEVSKNETLADLFLNFSGWKKEWASKKDLKSIDFKNYHQGVPLSIKQDSVLNLIQVYLLKNSLTQKGLVKKGQLLK